MKPKVLQYWPFFALLAFAAVLLVVLRLVGDPWSAREIASNIVFATAVAAATVVISRQQASATSELLSQQAAYSTKVLNEQARLQQSTAQAKLVEKIGSIAGALDGAWNTGQASTVQQILIDARAGLNLVSHADRRSRLEYLETVGAAVVRLHRIVHDWAKPYTLWEDEDWPLANRLARQLQTMLARQVPTADQGAPEFASLMATLQGFIDATGPHQELVPFDPFERSFRNPPSGDRFAPDMNWDLLRQYVESGSAKIVVARSISTVWLRERTAYSVWYSRKNGGKSATYTDADAEAIAFNDIDQYFKVLPKGTRSTIESLAWRYEVRDDGRLPTLEIVTFGLSADEVIVLDGNHRLGAIYYDRGERPLPVKLVEYRIEAPLDPALLPDLARYDRNRRLGSPAASS